MTGVEDHTGFTSASSFTVSKRLKLLQERQARRNGFQHLIWLEGLGVTRTPYDDDERFAYRERFGNLLLKYRCDEDNTKMHLTFLNTTAASDGFPTHEMTFVIPVPENSDSSKIDWAIDISQTIFMTVSYESPDDEPRCVSFISSASTSTQTKAASSI